MEQPLMSKTSCNLGSLNLYAFVDKKFTPEASFDWLGFENAVRITSAALDDIIDENAERLPGALSTYKENAKNWRNTGLGVFNYAHMLMALGLKYGSPEAIKFTNHLFEAMMTYAINYNIARAAERGHYPKFKKDIIKESKIFKYHQSLSALTNYERHGFRNCSLLSIAPTGSIATMLGGSGGIEPEFQFEYIRKTDNLNDSYRIFSKVVKDYEEVNGKINSLDELPDYFVAAKDINWKDRIDTQSAIQTHIDTAISSTINLPNEITKEEIEKLYLYAWQKGLKGVTIYRDGCKRSGILIGTDKKEERVEEKPKKTGLGRGEIAHTDDMYTIGFKRKLMTGCGSLHCTAFFDVRTGQLIETYLSKGSTGGCNNFMVGLSRMISLAARTGVPINDIIDQLMSTGACPAYASRTATKHDTSKGSCCPMAVGFALKEMWEEFNYTELPKKKQEKIEKFEEEKHIKQNQPTCPECGEPLYFEGGCNICKSCGWSKCD